MSRTIKSFLCRLVAQEQVICTLVDQEQVIYRLVAKEQGKFVTFRNTLLVNFLETFLYKNDCAKF